MMMGGGREGKRRRMRERAEGWKRVRVNGWEKNEKGREVEA